MKTYTLTEDEKEAIEGTLKRALYPEVAGDRIGSAALSILATLTPNPEPDKDLITECYTLANELESASWSALKEMGEGGIDLDKLTHEQRERVRIRREYELAAWLPILARHLSAGFGGGWIPVNERLPNRRETGVTSEEVWIAAKGKRWMAELVYSAKSPYRDPWFWATEHYDSRDRRTDFQLDQVTHWQQLPTPPEVKP